MLPSSFTSELLSEQLRPRCLNELAIPLEVIKRLEAMVTRRNVPNMLLYGSPGTGKTSAARIISSHFDTLTLNGSDQRKERSTVSLIEQFAATVSLEGKGKLCFIDEADYLPKDTQAVLRGLIEKYSSHCRFIMTANNKAKLSEALQSRLVAIHFIIPVQQRASILGHYTLTLHRKLKALGYEVTEEWLMQRVSTHFPDFRSIANNIEFNFG
jgi:DNA polymerase III delta prime subunit